MHDIFRITGGGKLRGAIEVKGAKNHVLKMMAAALLSEDTCAIKKVPDIEDVNRMMELIAATGASIERRNGDILISAKTISETTLPEALVRSIRTSVMLAGPLLVRTGEVTIPHPGGDKIGQRPIDLFLDGFSKLGVTVHDTHDAYRLTVKKLKGNTIIFRRVSVTATEAMIMTAACAEGTTVIKNAAMEPEILALAAYLNAHGAKIEGAGTPTLYIQGVQRLRAGEVILVPDRVEAGTFIILGLLTGSEITITNCNTEHLENLILHLQKAGAEMTIEPQAVTTRLSKTPLRATSVVTHEYPGFMTDLQAPYTVLMTQANGMSLIHETVYDGRLFYTDLLNSMGANIIMCDPHRVVVNGPTMLTGRYLTSPDIRAGMGLILAGLIARGETTIDNVYQIDRGYEHIIKRLQAIGANIQRIAP